MAYKPPSGYHKLPHDLILQVGENLDGKSLALWSMASKKAHEAVSGPQGARHKYQMELSKHGMLDGGTGLPSGELLRRLLFYLCAWDAGGSSLTDLPLQNTGIHTVYMGEHRQPSGSSFLGVSGGFFYQVSDRYTLDIYEMYSYRKVGRMEGAPPRVRRYVSKVPIQAVAIDSSQNLLVIMDSGIPVTNFHFVDLTTFQPHLEARQPSISVIPDSRYDIVVRQLEICGNTVGLLIAPEAKNQYRFKIKLPLCFVDWRRGSYSNVPEMRCPWAFYFLNEYQILIAEVVRSREYDLIPRLRVCDMRKQGHDRSIEYLFPWYGPAFRDRQPHSISFVKNVSSPTVDRLPSRAPFGFNPAARLVGITLNFGAHEADRPPHFPERTLLILNAGVFTSCNPNGYEWFSKCFIVAQSPGSDLTFIGRHLLSSTYHPQAGCSTITIQNLYNIPETSQIYYPPPPNMPVDCHRVCPFGTIMGLRGDRAKKVLATEDGLIFLPDNTPGRTASPFNIRFISF